MAKAFKWQLLKAEIFQRAVDQFIAAPLMVALNQYLRCKKITAATSLKPLIYNTAHSQVGVDNCIGPLKFKHILPAFTKRAAKDRPTKLLPVASAITQFNKPPDLIRILVAAPVTLIALRYITFDIVVKFAAFVLTAAWSSIIRTASP